MHGRRPGREVEFRVRTVSGAALVGTMLLTMANPWVFTQDDSIFYLVVGRHIAADGAWTFNGLIPTNGVQPLWQLASAGVLAVADLVSLDAPVGQMRALFVLNWALALVALAQMWRLLGRLGIGDPFRMVGIVVLAGCLCGPWGMFASEAHMVAVALLWLLLLIERWFRDGPGTGLAILVGCASGLLMLARLDTIWVVVSAFASLPIAVEGRPVRERLRLVLPAMVVATAIVVPYLTWNVVRFGHVTPISGAVKVDLSLRQLSINGIGIFGIAILGAIWGAGLLGVLRAPRQRSGTAVWLVAAVGATASSVFYAAFSRGTFTQWYWYYVPHAVALALAVPLLMRRLVEGRRRWRRRATTVGRFACLVLPVVLAAFCVDRIYLGPANGAWHEVRAFSRELSEALPEGVPVAAVDKPGVLAFVSGRPVLALDGLTGDYEFQGAIRDDGASCALEALGVRHVVTVYDERVVERDDASITLAVSSWLHLEPPTAVHGRDPLLVSSHHNFTLWKLVEDCDPPK